jgi:solute carrier family 25 citrate transporter 1
MSGKSRNPVTAMTAGCIAGGVEATAVWPMEYIKTQLQLQSKAKGAKLPYTGMVSGLSYTVRTTGFLSLYRGLAPTLIGSVPKAGIRFGLNSVIKDLLRDKDGKLTPGKNFLAGLGAGVSEALVIVAPVETVKTKCIELNMPFIKGLKHIVATEGIVGVYQGVSCCCDVLVYFNVFFFWELFWSYVRLSLYLSFFLKKSCFYSIGIRNSIETRIESRFTIYVVQ